jgi:hypothetical protein
MPLGAFQPPKPEIKPGAHTQFDHTTGSGRAPPTGYQDIRTAIAREKQLKSWRREKKLNLIRTINPEFKDLAQTWGW